MAQILAENVARYMEQKPDVDSGPKLRRYGITDGTLNRIRKQSHFVGIDKLERLARAFGCEPWELLVDGEQTREAIVRRFLGK